MKLINQRQLRYTAGLSALLALFGCNGGATTSLPATAVGPQSVAVAGNQSDSPAQTVRSAATQAASSTLGVTPLFSDARPGTTYPVKVTVPVAGHATIVATISCGTTTTGSTIVSLPGSWSLEAGLCNAGSNPTNGSGAHIWNSASGNQALPAAGLRANTPLLIAGTQDGSHVTYYVCPVGGTCSKSVVADWGSLASASAAIIGSSGSNIRNFKGHIWDVAMYVPLTDTQIQTLASSASTDPYVGPSPAPSPTPTPASTPTPAPPPGPAPAHVLTAEYYQGYGGYGGSATTLSHYADWAVGGGGVSAALAAGMKTYEYADPWIAYAGDGIGNYNDIAPGGADADIEAKNCNGTPLGSGSYFTDPIVDPAHAIAHFKKTITYWSSEEGTNTTAMFMDDTANAEYAANKPACDYTPQAWLQGAENMAAGVAPTQLIFNGLVNAEYSDEPSLIPLLNVANVMGGMYEDCYGFNGDEGMGSGDHAGGLNQHWTTTENTELAALATGKIFWCYNTMRGSGSSEISLRLYTYANFLLTYSSKALYQTEMTTPSSLRVYPETGIVPTQPLVATPNNVANLRTATGAYGREYAACYYRGASIGACAVVTNPDNGSSHGNPYSGYAHAVVVSGAGVLDGGTVTFGAPAPGSLAPLSAAILVR